MLTLPQSNVHISGNKSPIGLKRSSGVCIQVPSPPVSGCSRLGMKSPPPPDVTLMTISSSASLINLTVSAYSSGS